MSTTTQSDIDKPLPNEDPKGIIHILRKHKNYDLSFYRTQNVLGWSEYFVPDQKFIYILWQSQTFCARKKDGLHSVKLILGQHKSFWRSTKCSQIFGLAQKIWIGTKYFWTYQRTMESFSNKLCITPSIRDRVHRNKNFVEINPV